jgi:1,4-dihydroxy-2-naphthoyl-CoA hydrolase
MAIWFDKDLAEKFSFTKLPVKTILDTLGIQFTELGDDYLKGTMPVDERTHQPMGILHGGASCVLAESLGSVAASFCVDRSKNHVVGLDIHTTHIRSVSSGFVTGTAKPVHLGRSTQVWEISIVNEEGKLVSITRLTMFVKENK